MAQEHRQVRLAGATLERSRHVCALFHTADEAYATLLPFIRDGLEQGDRAFHIVDPAQRLGHALGTGRKARFADPAVGESGADDQPRE